MSERPTPERDALREAIDNGAAVEAEMTSLAGKLERERDGARAELEMWRDGNIMHEIHRDELEKVERERDEAREALREIQAAEWKTSGELRGMARKALEASK